MLILILSFTLAACAPPPPNNTSQENGMSALPAEPTVELDLPENVKAGQEVAIQVTVTQEGEPVNDADDVQIEIWKVGADADDHEFIVAEKTGDGVYSINKTFREPGEYKVMYHVTARGTHVMKSAETLIVQ